VDSLDRAQLEQERHLAVSIEAARGVLPEGLSVSVCVHCGNGIDSGRQSALPGVDSCVECARRVEMGLPLW